MIRRRGLPPVIWWMFGILLVAGLTVSLGGHEAQTNPSVSNYDASGQAALFSLLQRAGYSVTQDLATNPRFGPHDVAICLQPNHPIDALNPTQTNTEFYDNLKKFMKSGGRAVVFRSSGEFADDSDLATRVGPVTAKNLIVPQTLKIMAEKTNQPAADLMFQDVDVTPAWLTVWSAEGAALVRTTSFGKGALVTCDASIPASNRFLDREDDARFVVSVIQTVAQPGDHLRFTEASFGNVSDPGFFELLGSWALAAWRQAIVLFVVLIFTLGKRFGYPEERRRVVQSSRDMADAFGDLLFRARRVDLGLEMALARIDRRIRSRFRVPRDASVEERNRVLPEKIFKAISRVEGAAQDQNTRGAEALRLVQEADVEIDEYTFAVPPR